MFWDPDKPDRGQFVECPKYNLEKLTTGEQLLVFTEITIALYDRALPWKNRIFKQDPISSISDGRAKSEFTARCKFLMEKIFFSINASIDLEVVCPEWVMAGVDYGSEKMLIDEHKFFGLRHWVREHDTKRYRELLLVSTEGYEEALNKVLQTNIGEKW